MNFYNVEAVRNTSNNSKVNWIVGVDFIYGNKKDIVCKGGAMYAFWYDGKWNTNEYDLMHLIDEDVFRKVKELQTRDPETVVKPMLMRSNKSKVMKDFREYTKLSPQSEIQFNTKIFFADDKIKKTDYATTQLSYSPSEGPTPAFDELCGLLYEEEELDKILWFMGALLTNNMRNIQKFLYLYGGKGTGKGTILKIFKLLFEEYWAPIDLSNLTSDNSFATGEIKEVPLLIDDDTDLSSIKKDTNLLKLTAHEPLIINSKYKQTYSMRFEGLLITASNQRYKVRNVDSGITRRAIVAVPTNKVHRFKNYNNLMNRIPYELPMIADKAIKHFNEKGVDYYESYVDYDMIEATDYFYSFVRENAVGLGDPCTLKRASELYKLYMDDLGYDTSGYKRKVKNELSRYYNNFFTFKKMEGVSVKNVFEGFKWDIVFPDKAKIGDIKTVVTEEQLLKKLDITERDSIFDEIAKDYPAQQANKHGVPKVKWDDNTLTLSDIDTSQLHYVKVPLTHIVMDFDKKENGEKSLIANLKAIEQYPPTYTELSKSGKGVHLHYIYDGDVNKLDDIVDENVEIKVFKGNSSLRRQLSKCNGLDIQTISSGLPFKEEDSTMYKDIELIQLNEAKMRKIIKGNLEKKYHPNTKPSVDFIVKIFKDAKKEGIEYDLRDMRQDILAFASLSTNQAEACLKAISEIDYCTLKNEESEKLQTNTIMYPKEDLYFYDIEVFPNLLVVAFKQYGKHNKKTIWFNPTPEQIESLVRKPIIGFNNRRYDNHIMYARMLGEDNLSLFRQSQRIIDRKDGGNGMYGGAYELSYTDIYDYCSAANKKSLKKWEVELGIKHDEFELPWDKPVDKKDWPRVGEYCGNDVDATEAVFDATEGDYKARGILSALSGLSMNATTNQHTTKLIFGDVKDTSNDLVYTDLSEMFPGYKYEFGKSIYRGIDPKEGGYVEAKPGVYSNVRLYDVMSMHPFSAIALNAFGKYTKNFADLVYARIYIKHGELDKAGKLFDGKLKPFLTDPATIKDLANALKTAINSVYGLTKAHFDNPFRHPKNVDNIIAKRGALFMIDLKFYLEDLGYEVIHIKTDSIKIPNGDDKLDKLIFDFGQKYGYTFEHEATYQRLALINKAEYVCLDEEGKWSATGKTFKEPYVFKNLFTKEEIEKEDFFQVKEVKDAAIYLDDLFVGKFAEVYASKSGGELIRKVDDKHGYVNGTKGYKWKLSKDYRDRKDVDNLYYEEMVDSAKKAIEEVGNIEDILPIS